MPSIRELFLILYYNLSFCCCFYCRWLGFVAFKFWSPYKISRMLWVITFFILWNCLKEKRFVSIGGWSGTQIFFQVLLRCILLSHSPQHPNCFSRYCCQYPLHETTQIPFWSDLLSFSLLYRFEDIQEGALVFSAKDYCYTHFPLILEKWCGFVFLFCLKEHILCYLYFLSISNQSLFVDFTYRILQKNLQE